MAEELLIDDNGPLPSPVEPKPADVVFCNYDGTLDSKIAAWVVRGIARAYNIPVEFQEGVGHPGCPPLDGRNHIMIGGLEFPHNYDVINSKSLMSFMTIEKPALREPIPFQNWQRTWPYGIQTMCPDKGRFCGIHDPTRSLARIAWNFFCPTNTMPALIRYLDDAVTGRNQLPEAPAVYACLESYEPEVGKDLAAWDKLVKACENRKKLALIVVGGQAVLRCRKHNMID